MRVRANETGNLLDCRMAMLGLDLYGVESSDSGLFEEIVRKCLNCAVRDACALDLKRDPNSPVWETYCPNAATIIELAEWRWQSQ